MIQLEKSNIDKREYEYLNLDNGLQCIIIKDSDENLCGACLNIHVGSVNEKIDGLAHFLEHMVFMGSKKYPHSNDFMSSINSNGGQTNAYTSDTDTNYHFTIEPEKFPITLDKFSQFFREPLLKSEYVNKEINAVDSEAKKNLLDDNWIQLELYKTLLHESHPINHFTCGDLESLKISTIEEELKKFHNEYYDAKYMTLAVFINNDVNYEKIKSMIIENFGSIKSNSNLKEINRSYGKVLKDNTIVYYVPERDEIFLTVLFEVPTIKKSLDSPYEFISYIFGSELDKSLYTQLLQKGYVTKLMVSELLNFDDYTIINAEYILTEDGEKNVEEIYTTTIKYFEFILNKLKTRDSELEKLYLEMKQNNLNNFNYWQNTTIIDTILPLTNIMKEDLPKEYILSYDIHLPDFDRLCEIVLQQINSYSVAVSFGSKNNSKLCKTIFPRYKVCYKLDTMKDITNTMDTKGIINFMLPLLNNYICYNLKIDETIKQLDEPILIKSDNYNLFYYGDKKYKTPVIDIRTTIKMPKILDSPEAYVATLLYLNSAYGDINELKEMAKLASYTIYLKLDYDTLYILISGYNENMHKVIDLIQKIFNHEFKERSFKTAHYELLKDLKNHHKDSPITQLVVQFEKLIFDKYYTPTEQYNAAKSMTIQKCKDIFKKVYTDCRVNILTTGNITHNNCINLINRYYKNLNINTPQLDLYLEDNLNRIYKNKIEIIQNKNLEETNSIASVIYDFDRFRKTYTKDWKSRVLFYRVLNTLISNKFFYELRTKKQMGYIVKVRTLIVNSNNNSNVFLQFIIQSPKYSCKEILDEINKFIENEIVYIMEQMPLDEYLTALNAEKVKLKEKFNNLNELGSYFMNALIDESFNFKFKDDLLRKTEEFTFDKFKKYFNKYMIENKKVYNIGIEKKKSNIYVEKN
jgi:insulysin